MPKDLIFYTPEQFTSKAIFPTSITGPVIENDVTMADSHNHCIKHITNVLADYLYAARAMKSHTNISKFTKQGHRQFRGHSPVATGWSTYLYCPRCFSDCEEAKEWSCNVIANLKYSLFTNVDGTICARVKVVAVHPHPSNECNVPL